MNKIWKAVFQVHKNGIGDLDYTWIVAAPSWFTALNRIEERFFGDIVTMVSMEYIGVLEIAP